MPKYKLNPTFKRNEVAQILGVTRLTISNREKKKLYPIPQRDLNGYRIYSLDDVLNLQLISFGRVNPKPIFEILFEKGYDDPQEASRIVSEALKKRLAYG